MRDASAATLCTLWKHDNNWYNWDIEMLRDIRRWDNFIKQLLLIGAIITDHIKSKDYIVDLLSKGLMRELV